MGGLRHYRSVSHVFIHILQGKKKVITIIFRNISRSHAIRSIALVPIILSPCRMYNGRYPSFFSLCSAFAAGAPHTRYERHVYLLLKIYVVPFASHRRFSTSTNRRMRDSTDVRRRSMLDTFYIEFVSVVLISCGTFLTHIVLSFLYVSHTLYIHSLYVPLGFDLDFFQTRFLRANYISDTI